MPEHERTLMHVRLNHQSVETLKHARHVTGFHTNQEVIDEALKLYNMVLSNEFDKSKEEIMSNAHEDIRRVEKLEQWANSDKVVTREVIKEVIPVAVAQYIDTDLTKTFPRVKDNRQRPALLALCGEKSEAEIEKWAKRYEDELNAVGWDVETFVRAKEKWDEEHVHIVKATITPALVQPGPSSVEQRIASMARRLYIIALGHGRGFDGGFDSEMGFIRSLGLAGSGKQEEFKAAVLKSFHNKALKDYTEGKIKQSDVETTVKGFEDRWIMMFGMPVEEKQKVGELNGVESW